MHPRSKPQNSASTDEVPNFAHYVMGAMARRIRGMGETLK
jgi:hypothetical protein